MSKLNPWICAIIAALLHPMIMMLSGGIAGVLSELVFMLITGVAVFFIVNHTMKKIP